MAEQSHGQPAVVPRGALSVVDVPLNMTRQRGQFQVTFHPNGSIAGIYLLNA